VEESPNNPQPLLPELLERESDDEP
jgi:hypothetical protein